MNPYRENTAPLAPDVVRKPDRLGFVLEMYERFLNREINYEQLHEALDGKG